MYHQRHVQLINFSIETTANDNHDGLRFACYSKATELIVLTNMTTRLVGQVIKD